MATARPGGQPPGHLTPAQRDTWARLAEGWTNTAIARQRGRSRRTVDTHVAAVYAALDLPRAGYHSRVVAALIWHLRLSTTTVDGAPE